MLQTLRYAILPQTPPGASVVRSSTLPEHKAVFVTLAVC